MWQALIAPIAGIVKSFQEGKQKKREAKHAVDMLHANAAASDAEMAGKIALVNAENANNTWKDEYALIVITAPVVLGQIVGVCEAFGGVAPGTTQAVMTAMFSPISTLPEFWANTFQVGILSALGVNLWSKAQRNG